jgi:Domain of unknown function (DUF4331)
MKHYSILLLVTLAGACGDDDGGGAVCGEGTVLQDGACVPEGGITCGAGTMDDGSGVCVPVTNPTNFVQVEHLARPGINEALLITDGFLNGYNATAPTFTGVDSATLGQVVGEAKTVLKALYLGACLLNGTIPGVNATNGVHPAGIQCHAIGTAIWTENSLSGVTLTQASKDASQAYADAVFGLFIPDVMRVDTGVTSNYQVLCGAGASVGLCGGRFPNDDVIDVTYDFLLNGAATPKGAFDQVHALVQDGVVFDNVNDANNSLNRIAGDPSNRNQGHPTIAQGFPYSAAPF